MANVYTAPSFQQNEEPLYDPRAVPGDQAHRLMLIMDRLDPLGEIDQHHDLLTDCLRTTRQLREIYSNFGNFEFPENFQEALYERELRYVRRGMEGIRSLLELNEKAGNKVEVVKVLFDFDRSQVAVADTASGKYMHIPRPGWGYLVRRMDEMVHPASLYCGALSDRAMDFDSDQSYDTSGHGLKDHASVLFTEAGISKYLDTSLVISCTDGLIANSMRPVMQEQMRRKSDRKLGEVAQMQVKAGQFAELAEVIDADKVSAETLVYHPKLGTIAYLAANSPPGVVYYTLDDLKSVKILHSARAVGVFVEPDMQPLLPDEALLKPEEYHFNF